MAKPNPWRIPPFWLSLLFAGGAFLIFFLLFTQRFDTNDDVRMQLIVSGRGLVTESDPHVLYSHIIVGYLLQGLYQAAPAIPWYGLYLNLAHFAAWFLLGVAFFRRGYSPTRLGWFAALFLLWELPQLLYLQFTSTAFLLAVAGLFVLAEMREGKWVLAGGIAIWVASLMRFPAAGLAGLLALPFLIAKLGEADKDADDRSFSLGNYRNLSTLSLLIAAALSLTFFLSNRHAYQEEESWNTFYQMDALRSGVIDYDRLPYSPQNAEFYQSLGWTESAYALYKSWFVADTLVFEPTDLEEIRNAQSPLSTLRLAGRRLFSSLQPNFFPFLLLLAWLLLLPFFPLKQDGYLVLWASVLLTTGVLFMLIVFFYLHTQISYPICGFLLLLTGWYSFGTSNFSFSVKKLSLQVAARRQAFFLLLLLLALLTTTLYTFRNHLDKQKIAATLLAWESVAPTEEDVFVVWADSFPYEYIVLPWQERRLLMERTHLLSTGLTYYTPFFGNMAHLHEITSLHEALLQPGVFLVAREEFLPLYQNFMREYYGEKRYFLPIQAYPEAGLWVWQVVPWEF